MAYRARRLWGIVQGSLWFVPSCLVAFCGGLALLMVWLDREYGSQIAQFLPIRLEVTTDSAREMLSTIAGSMLTVASVAFSFTIVIFSFASSQYSSRTLHNLMDDNTNQVVLGVLLGSYVYCLLVLRTLPQGDVGFAPVLSTTGALALALTDLGLFILFIHHVAESIQAYHLIHRIGQRTGRSAQHLFPSDIGTPATYAEEPQHLREMSMCEVQAERTGYIQMVDAVPLIEEAEKRDLVIVLKKRVGNFVAVGEEVAVIGPAERVDDSVRRRIAHSFIVGPYRTLFQDAAYGILQLSDIAVKALSPAINDPNTAIMSLNQLDVILRQIAVQEVPSPYRAGADGKLRVVAEGTDFEDLIGQAFDQVRRYAMSDASVPLKMLDVISEVAEVTRSEERLAVLRRHAIAILEDCDRNIAPRRDRAMINEKMRSMCGTLQVELGEIAFLSVE